MPLLNLKPSLWPRRRALLPDSSHSGLMGTGPPPPTPVPLFPHLMLHQSSYLLFLSCPLLSSLTEALFRGGGSGVGLCSVLPEFHLVKAGLTYLFCLLYICFIFKIIHEYP